MGAITNPPTRPTADTRRVDNVEFRRGGRVFVTVVYMSAGVEARRFTLEASNGFSPGGGVRFAGVELEQWSPTVPNGLTTVVTAFASTGGSLVAKLDAVEATMFGDGRIV